MANTAQLLYEAAEAARDMGHTGLSSKISEAFKSFQEFERRYNEDRLQSEDFEALKSICRSDVQISDVYKGGYTWGAHGSLAAAILWRHGVDAGVDDRTGNATFEKAS